MLKVQMLIGDWGNLVMSNGLVGSNPKFWNIQVACIIQGDFYFLVTGTSQGFAPEIVGDFEFFPTGRSTKKEKIRHWAPKADLGMKIIPLFLLL